MRKSGVLDWLQSGRTYWGRRVESSWAFNFMFVWVFYNYPWLCQQWLRGSRPGARIGVCTQIRVNIYALFVILHQNLSKFLHTSSGEFRHSLILKVTLKQIVSRPWSHIPWISHNLGAYWSQRTRSCPVERVNEVPCGGTDRIKTPYCHPQQCKWFPLSETHYSLGCVGTWL